MKLTFEELQSQQNDLWDKFKEDESTLFANNGWSGDEYWDNFFSNAQEQIKEDGLVDRFMRWCCKSYAVFKFIPVCYYGVKRWLDRKNKENKE